MSNSATALALLSALVWLTLAGCAEPPVEGDEQAAEVPESAAGRMSYGAGFALASSVREQLGEDFDAVGFRAGILDALADRELQVTDAQLEQARDEIVARRDASQGAQAADNLEAARTFLAENANREGVIVTDSGLQYEVLQSGDGASPGPESQVVTHYTGRLADGSVFDSSEARGEPAQFGVDQVIQGWQEALQLMQEGDRLRIWLPPELAYGSRGAGADIPPNAALVFEVELIEVVDP
ncbi:MAG: FKBP-type peptidyl-prolyl cis-trans isomerase [Gammaproteobacteria bacterium]|nr:MAG: FKBP-type peptidyl-prolyl cis-trans isomerase [Gammaproteobacteria bacterium]